MSALQECMCNHASDLVIHQTPVTDGQVSSLKSFWGKPTKNAKICRKSPERLRRLFSKQTATAKDYLSTTDGVEA